MDLSYRPAQNCFRAEMRAFLTATLPKATAEKVARLERDNPDIGTQGLPAINERKGLSPLRKSIVWPQRRNRSGAACRT